MGTHPIFESDFDCLTDWSRTRKYVACFTRQVPAHFACSEYQHRWYSQHHVRHDRHSWYWSSLLQPDLQKADIDLSKRAGQLDDDEIRRMETIMLNPRQYKIPDWFLNRQKDWKDGTFGQSISNGLDTKLREDLERLKKIRAHRGLRHHWLLRVRGQHTKTTGRRGRTVGVSKKK